MKTYILSKTDHGANVGEVLERWKSDEFYESAVVLGIDVGLEGIGVCVRRGPQVLHAATWMISWPESLEARRQKRAWRHCRRNLKVRMQRLSTLFQKHGLPWFSERDPALLKTDPFELRYRAVTGGLASKEALAIAVRHAVAHRGHDYTYFNSEGEFPWGDSVEYDNVCEAVRGRYFTKEEIDRFSEVCATFDWKQDQVEAFRGLIAGQLASADGIRDHLEAYHREPRRNRKVSPKGIAYPRTLVWRHIEEMVRKNAHLLDDADGFLCELGVHPKESKDRAIFHYHRKTPEEMRRHFESKIKRCRYAEALGLGEDLPCDKREKSEIGRFLLLEFLASRRIELATGMRIHLPASVIETVLKWRADRDTAGERPAWKDGRKMFLAALKNEGLGAPAKGSSFIKDYMETLEGLLCPKASNLRLVSNLSVAAARGLYEIATATGFDPEMIKARLQEYYKERRAAVLDPAGRYPQVDFLLGAVARKTRVPTKRHPNRRKRGEEASRGQLQKLFAKLAPQLDGKVVPDYCIIEVIGDAPRSERTKKKIADEMKKRRDMARAAFDALRAEDRGSRTARLRLKLHAQQAGCSPFTGRPLGEDPLASELALCHLFPDSRGGLFTEDNLVLAPVDENNRMANRTPREAASDLAGSWESMLAHANGMNWSARKRKIFEWDGEGIPDFGNTTRMSQLARQLYSAVGRWMGVDDIEDPTVRENRRAERIGTPAGFLTSVARVSWGLPRKEREDLVHHLVDAVTLAWLPPGKGMNSAQYGGIFFNQYNAETGKTRLSVLPLGPDPQVVERLTAHDASECPVVHFRSSSRVRQMHDTTLLGVGPDGELSVRVPFEKDKAKMDVITLRQKLVLQGVSASQIPSETKLLEWLEAPDGTPLTLRGGQIIRRRREPTTKRGNVFPGLGIVGAHNSLGGWQGVKIFDASLYDGVALWRAWEPVKRKWRFLLRRIPDPQAMEATLRAGFSWFEAARMTLRDTLDVPLFDRMEKLERSLRMHPFRWLRIRRGPLAEATLRDLVLAGFPLGGTGSVKWEDVSKAVYGDELPSGAEPLRDRQSGRAIIIRKGQTFRIPVTPEGKWPAAGAARAEHWYRVSALKSDGRVEFAPLRMMEFPKISLSRENLFSLFGFGTEDGSPPDSSK